jgi:predicted PurR-regulated permease PerM
MEFMSGTSTAWRYWAAALAVLLVGLWALSSVLLPFVAGMAIAYFLDPVADWLEARGISRWLATTLVLALFSVLLIAFLLLLIPVLQNQVVGFASRLPGYVDGLRATLVPLVGDTAERLGIDLAADARAAVGDAARGVLNVFGRILDRLWSGGMALFNILSMLVITPVVAFYLLRDYDLIVAKVDHWLPRRQAATIRDLLGQIDDVMAGFIRGQGTVCVLLALYYGISLSLVGLEFGLVIGLISGLVSFIPFIGALLGLLLSALTALTQFLPDGDLIRLGAVGVIFVVGQFLEGNILTPRLLGDHLGLHPVWIVFALFAGGALFGFVGVLLAVPAAAAIGVLVRFGIQRYLDSELYGGGPPSGASG